MENRWMCSTFEDTKHAYSNAAENTNRINELFLQQTLECGIKVRSPDIPMRTW